MYSMVLMAALTTAPEAPTARHRSHGCDSGCAPACAGHAQRGKKHRGNGHAGCGGCGGCAPAMACGGGGGCGPMAAGCGGYAMATDGAMMGAPAMALGGTVPWTTEATPAAPATLVVTGAADATVTVGDYVTTSRGDTRTLVTPELAAGQAYHYDLKAEVVRDGQRVTLSQAVTVRPGETTEVKLDFAAGAVVMK